MIKEIEIVKDNKINNLLLILLILMLIINIIDYIKLNNKITELKFINNDLQKIIENYEEFQDYQQIKVDMKKEGITTTINE